MFLYSRIAIACAAGHTLSEVSHISPKHAPKGWYSAICGTIHPHKRRSVPVAHHKPLGGRLSNPVENHKPFGGRSSNPVEIPKSFGGGSSNPVENPKPFDRNSSYPVEIHKPFGGASLNPVENIKSVDRNSSNPVEISKSYDGNSSNPVNTHCRSHWSNKQVYKCSRRMVWHKKESFLAMDFCREKKN